jgi:hypothetical protein
VYTGELKFNDDNDDEDEGKLLLQLLDLAVKFNLEGLGDKCLWGLKNVINLQNVECV